mmetsp:Transcript_67061/g.183936  ORF Transcript_67061/g.183936 Transcript_67061/m.183936 type:complete len:230 (+) Transcript_67061:494-1183(+)
MSRDEGSDVPRGAVPAAPAAWLGGAAALARARLPAARAHRRLCARAPGVAARAENAGIRAARERHAARAWLLCHRLPAPRCGQRRRQGGATRLRRRGARRGARGVPAAPRRRPSQRDRASRHMAARHTCTPRARSRRVRPLRPYVAAARRAAPVRAAELRRAARGGRGAPALAPDLPPRPQAGQCAPDGLRHRQARRPRLWHCRRRRRRRRRSRVAEARAPRQRLTRLL